MPVLDFPSFKQTTDYGCGPSTMQSILTYFGIDISNKKLIEMLKTDENGTSTDNTVSTAKKFKLRIKEGQLTVDDLKNNKYPILIRFQAWPKSLKDINNSWSDDHYAVVIGYSNNKIILEDPLAPNRIKISPEELDKRWHGTETNSDKKLYRWGCIFMGKEISHTAMINNIKKELKISHVKKIAKEILSTSISVYKTVSDIENVVSILRATTKNKSVRFKPYRSWDKYTSFSKSNKGYVGLMRHKIAFTKHFSEINNLIEVEYNEKFLRKHLDIFKHIIADNLTIKEYIDNEIKADPDLNEKDWIKWFKEGYAGEKEVVAPLVVKLDKACIAFVELPGDAYLKYLKEFKDIFDIKIDK